MSGAKAHTYNTYGNIASFTVDNGILQTGIAYPNSWNATHETPFAVDHIDGSSIEFVGRGLDFNPNDYKLVKIIVLE